jgi:hypothetical protein
VFRVPLAGVHTGALLDPWAEKNGSGRPAHALIERHLDGPDSVGVAQRVLSILTCVPILAKLQVSATRGPPTNRLPGEGFARCV